MAVGELYHFCVVIYFAPICYKDYSTNLQQNLIPYTEAKVLIEFTTVHSNPLESKCYACCANEFMT